MPDGGQRTDAETLLYEGKAKRIYATDDPGLVRVHFKDDATAFDGARRATVGGKGEVNARISAALLRRVEAAGVPTHLVRVLGPRDHLCTRVDIVPIEVVVRNVAAGSLCRRLGREEGEELPFPMVEFFYKDDALHDPPISDVHALAFGWAVEWELAYMRHAAKVVNEVLSAFWDELGIRLVDFKLEFGRAGAGRLLLADEITPDGSRLWEKATGRHLDKDVFRLDLGDLGATYRELLERVMAAEEA